MFIKCFRSHLSSWSGRRDSVNPYCRVHGTRAKMEAFAAENIIKANQDLQKALEEEEQANDVSQHGFIFQSTFLNFRFYSAVKS